MAKIPTILGEKAEKELEVWRTKAWKYPYGPGPVLPRAEIYPGGLPSHPHRPLDEYGMPDPLWRPGQ